MDLQKYTESAMKTEAVLDDVYTNQVRLINILKISIAAGNMLDDLKKNIFYGREIDNTKYFQQFNLALDSLHSLEIYQPGAHKKPLDQNELIDQDMKIDSRIFHGAIGMATESTEMLEALLKYLETGELDKINLAEECGDSDWYEAILLNALGQDWEKNMKKNIKKLKLRYEKQQFEAENANNRDLDSEREILES